MPDETPPTPDEKLEDAIKDPTKDAVERLLKDDSLTQEEKEGILDKIDADNAGPVPENDDDLE